jgi:hypothetical protein
MRKIGFLIFIVLSVKADAQIDYSGIYGFDGTSYTKDLTMLKIDANHYKFWMSAASEKYINTGDGIIEVKGDSGIYKILDKSNSEFQYCNLVFKLTSKNIEVASEKSEKICHVLFGSHIITTYPLIKSARISQKEFLNAYQEDYTLYKVISDETVLYLDSSITRKGNHYFKKGDILIESGYNTFPAVKSIQVEYLSNSGEFISGWIKKEAVVVIKK